MISVPLKMVWPLSSNQKQFVSLGPTKNEKNTNSTMDYFDLPRVYRLSISQATHFRLCLIQNQFNPVIIFTLSEPSRPSAWWTEFCSQRVDLYHTLIVAYVFKIRNSKDFKS